METTNWRAVIQQGHQEPARTRNNINNSNKIRMDVFAPPEGSIQCGRVSRIESYGAFIQLDRFRARGLVHISHLASCMIEKVEDAVSLDEEVWVKVLEVQKQMDETTGKMRHKVSLSMKFASQDGSKKDLQIEAEAGATAHRALEQTLTGNIGMGIALDPMAAFAKTSSGNDRRIVLKSSQAKKTIINGYALVDDTEGEPEPTFPLPGTGTVHAPPAPMRTVPSVPMGRGRGSTLPAWMTTQQAETNKDGPRGSGGGGHKSGSPYSDDDNDSYSSDDSRSRQRREKKKRKIHSKDQKKKKKHRKHSKDRSHKHHSSKRHNDHHRREDRKHRRRSRSFSDSDSERYDNHKESQSYNRKEKRSNGESDGEKFTSVEQAKQLIADLEANKLKR